MAKYVYTFGGGKAEGRAEMRDLLGGKGANLAEMALIGIPVPAGFTITTELCTYYYANGLTYPPSLDAEVTAALEFTCAIMGKKFADPADPLLLSVRSGARSSMPGMMETVLNVGLCSATIPGLIEKTGGNERFVYDAYRRLIMMYSDVVMEKAAGIEPAEGRGIRMQLEHLMEAMKKARGVKGDTELTAADLKELTASFKQRVEDVLGVPFPDTPLEQLWGAVGAVFKSWNGKRAVAYRNIEGIPHEWGTAVNVQAMVFGNMGEKSATGVAFTRNPATGDKEFFGEWLTNAQGEDVVAGTRTPYALNRHCVNPGNEGMPTLEDMMPALYQELHDIRDKLEAHFKDMQDLEFTIQEGRLWMLQTRTGKRNGPAAVRMAVEMADEGLIDRRIAVSRVKPNQLDELLHPMVDPSTEAKFHPLAQGLPAGPGGGYGKIVLTAERAQEWAAKGEPVVLVRAETSPEDVHGMHVAQAIVTAKGGMTSHAALVARGWGKTCVVGCSAIDIDLEAGIVRIGDVTLKEGDSITVNGTRGLIYQGALPLIVLDPEKNEVLRSFLSWCDEIRKLGIRTNADRPVDAAQARRFGAEGVGLCRTEHMFFGEERIKSMREMILADNDQDRAAALEKLLPFQRADFKGIFQAMEGLPVTVRLLDPPLHEFVPHEEEQIEELAKIMGKDADTVRARVEQLKEQNPMLGHRGCRLGITYPQVTRMQTRAILEAAAILKKEGVKALPEIMVPLVGNVKELENQKKLILEVAEEVKKEQGVPDLEFLIGTMIEVPRAAITADKIAVEAEFFSFGTNDLTQMTCAFSRDDAGTFLPYYVKSGIYVKDPFESIDQEGVGQMVAFGVERGRKTRPNLKIGVCGEHGGDPDSIHFFHKVGLNYVSCSPFRVPIARLAAAQAALNDK